MNQEIPHQTIYDPRGLIKPGWLGQMFFDNATHDFYQARSLGENDWRLIPPADFVGSFVKIYDFFIGIPADDTTERQRVIDSEAVKETMAMDGVRLLQAFCWRANETTAAMVRFKFDHVRDLSIFFGYASDPRPHTMPVGIGFRIEDGVLEWGGENRDLIPGDIIALRIETTLTASCAYLNDARFLSTTAVLDGHPIVAVFNRGPGDRPTAPGYDRAMKRLMEQ